MPLLINSSYKAPFWLPGGHAQTVFPVVMRRIGDLPFARVRIDTPDQDFIDLDFFTAAMRSDLDAQGVPAGPEERSDKGVVIINHGLEGNSRRKYIRGMCLLFTEAGFDCVARNCRGCGGEMNLRPGMYHSGQTGDVHTAVEYCLSLGYRRIFLAGFSMGGNQVLKYLGEDPERVPPEVAGAVAFSAPCDLAGSAYELERPANSMYMRYFLQTLREKVRQKHSLFPDEYPLEGLDAMRTFAEFDGRYTAPVFGFASAQDYWEKSSSLPVLTRIDRPALLVNAKNDPFLSPSCLPVTVAEQSRFFSLETPEEGGHVGFVPDTWNGRTAYAGQNVGGGMHAARTVYWSEARALRFLQEIA